MKAGFLLNAPEPWTRYRARLDLLEQPQDDPAVQAERAALLAHPQVAALLKISAAWGGQPLKRHNDASHPLYAFSTLADFGLRSADPGLESVTQALLAHQSPEGAFLSPVLIPHAFGGTGETMWTWLACDAPTLLFILVSFGQGQDARLQRAAAHLASLVDDNGYHCVADPQLGKFHGPGRRSDPCPVANVYALKALSLLPEYAASPAAHQAAAMLLDLWQERKARKYYLFGMGTDFQKLKYPYVYFDILHTLEALSLCDFARQDARFGEMLAAVTAQADEEGRYTAGSMYKTWKGWSFADKKKPSPWLTFLVWRICKRAGVSAA